MPSDVQIKYTIINFVYPMIFFIPRHKDMQVHGKVTSAGFFKIKNGKVETYGYSSSMRMGPQPEDAALLEMYLGLDNGN